MPRFAAQMVRYAEYSILTDACPIGLSVGFYAGRPISGTVIDERGHEYIYVGLARRMNNGQYDVDSLAAGEWIVEPGLIYRQVLAMPGKRGRAGLDPATPVACPQRGAVGFIDNFAGARHCGAAP
jgi:hypothetical protein